MYFSFDFRFYLVFYPFWYWPLRTGGGFFLLNVYIYIYIHKICPLSLTKVICWKLFVDSYLLTTKLAIFCCQSIVCNITSEFIYSFWIDIIPVLLRVLHGNLVHLSYYKTNWYGKYSITKCSWVVEENPETTKKYST